MLVLTIKEGQKVRIGDDVSVSFQHSYNYEKRYSKVVKLAVEAPAHINVVRQEIKK